MKTNYKFNPKKYIKYNDFFNLEFLLKEYETALAKKEIKGKKVFSKFSFSDIEYKEKLENWLKLYPNSYYAHFASALYWKTWA